MASPKYSLDGADWRKIVKGFGIGLAGAALVYLASFVGLLDLGQWTPIAVVVAASIANIGRKFVAESGVELQ